MEHDELRALPPLAGMSDEGLARVAACAAELVAEAGQVIAVADDPGSGMFVIREGTVCVELRGKVTGPFVLHERMKGKDDETLDDLVYVRKIVISRKMMDAVIADVEKQFKKADPPKPGKPAPKPAPGA